MAASMLWRWNILIVTTVSFRAWRGRKKNFAVRLWLSLLRFAAGS